MQKITIGEKDYAVNVTWGQMQKAFKVEARFKEKIERKIRLRFPDIEKQKLVEEINFQAGIPVSLIMIWAFLKRRWYGLKPFVFKRWMINHIRVKEIRKNYEAITKWMSWEDKEGKNLN